MEKFTYYEVLKWFWELIFGVAWRCALIAVVVVSCSVLAYYQ